MSTLPPGKQRDQLLVQLRSTRDALMSPDWLSRIRDATPEQRTRSAESLLKTQLAILDLENLRLAEIRDDIVTHSDELTAATGKLKDALEDLKRTATVLMALGGFLDAVAKVIKFF